MDSLLGIALINTFIGLDNINKNTQQYEKQRLTNAKIDKIYGFLKEQEDCEMDLHKYINKIDSEISALIEKESMTATSIGERDLFYLLENRKNIIKWAEEKNGHYTGRTETATDKKSYFGGV